MKEMICVEEANKNSVYVEITKDALVKLVEAPIKQIDSMLKSNQRKLQGGTGVAYTPYKKYGRKKNGMKTALPPNINESMFLGQHHSTYVTDEIREAVEQFTRTLDALLLRQIETLIAIQEENRLAPLHFVRDVSTTQVCIGRTVLATSCEDCGHIIQLARLEAHQGTIKCLQSTGERDLREAGWTVITDLRQLTAVKQAGIQCDIRPAAFNTWIPSWVKTAIAKYDNGDSGYAGLKLAEFLRKINQK